MWSPAHIHSVLEMRCSSPLTASGWPERYRRGPPARYVLAHQFHHLPNTEREHMKYKMSGGIKVFRNKNGMYRRGFTATTRSLYGHHHSYLGKEKRGLLLAGSSSSHASSLGDGVATG